MLDLAAWAMRVFRGRSTAGIGCAERHLVKFATARLAPPGGSGGCAMGTVVGRLVPQVHPVVRNPRR